MTMGHERSDGATGLQYDRASHRWMLRGRPLHCGDGLDVRVGGHWLPCRVEFDGRLGWILLTDFDTVRILPSARLSVRPDRADGRW